MMRESKQKINLALVSDFFIPYTGGVELHIQKLASLLPKKAQIQKVIVITHKYEQFGDQYIGVVEGRGYRIYYLNIFYNRKNMVIMPSFWFDFPEARRILNYEKINIVHCHQSSSTLALEYIIYCKALGIRVILTEHSLIGFREVSHIIYNKFSEIFLTKCNKIIAVSQTAKNNLILRASLHPKNIIVIPNGVQKFNLFKKERSDQQIRIIVVGRVAHRRGADILIDALPHLCQIDPNIRIWVVGDGPKLQTLKARITLCQLENQVKLFGVKPHSQALELLTQCDIFLNVPLTQSFGIALAQAAQVGLYCISTDVGAIHESIPKQCLTLISLNSSSVVKAVSLKVWKLKKQQKSQRRHSKQFEYSWNDVVDRTVEVYSKTLEQKSQKKLGIKDLRLTSKDLNALLLYLIILLVQLIYDIADRATNKPKSQNLPKTFNKGLS